MGCKRGQLLGGSSHPPGGGGPTPPAKGLNVFSGAGATKVAGRVSKPDELSTSIKPPWTCPARVKGQGQDQGEGLGVGKG